MPSCTTTLQPSSCHGQRRPTSAALSRSRCHRCLPHLRDRHECVPVGALALACAARPPRPNAQSLTLLSHLLPLRIALVDAAVALTQIFPYLAFMIQHYNMTSDRTKVGYYAGILASSYSLAALLSSLMWGRLSDRLGRRPILLWGMLATSITTVCFGFCENYAAAVCVRFLQGLLNGNIGVMKTYLAEALPSVHKARGFSILGVVDSVGYAIGPLIGGVSCMPAGKYGWFDTAFWRRFPFLLPCLVAASISLVGLVMGACVLRETLAQAQSVGAWLRQLARRVRSPAHKYVNLVNEHSVDEVETAAASRTSAGAHDSSTYSSHADDAGVAARVAAIGKGSVLRLREVVVATWLYGLLCFIYTMDEEAFPLLAVGAMKLSSTTIGVIMGGCSLVSMSAMLAYPRFARRIGHVAMFRWTMLLMGPAFAVVPLAGALGLGWHALVLLLFVLTAIKYILASYVYTAVIIMISNSAPNASLGSVNGLGQTKAAAARMLAPVVGGVVLAWSMQHHGWLVNYGFLFVVLMLLSVLNAGIALTVGAELNVAYDERHCDPGSQPLDSLPEGIAKLAPQA